MPSPIEVLKHRLAESVRVLAPEGRLFSLTGVEKMRERVERIRLEIGDRPSKPSADRICGALNKMRLGKPATLVGAEFFFVCWGLTTRCGNQSVLMEDAARFTEWMAEVRRRQPTTLAWQGLLDAYFRYERVAEQAMGEKNWDKLRGWLEKDLAGLRQRTPAGMLPLLPWLNTLSDQRNLLGNNPCRPYAEWALRGEQGRIDRIKADLGIPPTSWFWRELVFSQIEEAVGWREDARFKQVLDTLLAQLVEHPVLRDKGLAKLLTRYAGCADHSTHTSLKQFALKSWGNPHSGNLWKLVQPAVRKMVQEWVALEDLCDFFALVKGNPETDRLRLEFWSRYIGQMTRTHLVLGPDAWDELKGLRERKKGRVSKLLSPIKRSNNAFVMQLGEYVFVEFSVTGNAAYGYPASAMERLLSQSTVDRKDLADRGKAIFYEWHTPPQRWPMGKFAPILRDLGFIADTTTRRCE